MIRFTRQTIFVVTMLFVLISCMSSKRVDSGSLKTSEKTEDLSTGENKYIISAPLVQKNFVKKNGQETGIKEWYIRRSVQDYFIKFCESSVTSYELKEQLVKKNSESLTMEVEFREGSWDICDDNEMQQSRIGKYVVIHRIIE